MNCLSAPAEVSPWTKFCELDVPTAVRQEGAPSFGIFERIEVRSSVSDPVLICLVDSDSDYGSRILNRIVLNEFCPT
jgi:hypothetical protein